MSNNQILWLAGSQNSSIIRPSIKLICQPILILTIIYRRERWLLVINKTSIYLQVDYHMKKLRGLLQYPVKIMDPRSRCRSQMKKFRRCNELVEEVTVVTTTRECQAYLIVFRGRLEAQVLARSPPNCTLRMCWGKERDKATTVCLLI